MNSVADQVDVIVRERAEEVEAVISDNGRGFDLEESYGGFGLLGMRERVAFLGGNLSIESSPEQGTTVRVVVPTRRNSAAESVASSLSA